jgi:uncharacterized protein YtpQ (UPF0354 family)
MRLLALALIAALSSPTWTRAQTMPLDPDGFTAHVASLLRQAVGDSAVTIKGPLTIGLGELQANLDRVHAFCQRERGACEAEVTRYVKGAAEVHRDRTAPLQPAAVRVVLRTTQYVQSVQGAGTGAPVALQPRPFVDGLVALPAGDSPRAIRMLGEKDNAQLGLSAAEVFELGLKNLRSTLKPLMEVAQLARPGQIGQIAGDSYDPSRLLLHDTWAPLVQAQGGQLIVALPVTDALFFIAEDTPQAIDALRAWSRNVQSRSPNRLSDQLLRWTDTGWVVLR